MSGSPLKGRIINFAEEEDSEGIHLEVLGTRNVGRIIIALICYI